MIRAIFNRKSRALLAASLFLAFHAYAAVMTNKDVISLLEAGMGEDVVLQAILTSDTKFDTSAQALIRLKQKGATPAILKAMMPGGKEQSARKPSQPQASAPVERRAAAAGGLDPEVALIVLDGRETPMQHIVPGKRTAVRALGLGGVATYGVLNGPKAQRRIPASNVEFIVLVPRSVQVANYVSLANFVVRENGAREVFMGGGVMSISMGIHPDRIVPTVAEPHEDQSRARDGYVLYRVRVPNPMPPGEYALVLMSDAFTGFYELGVD